MSKVDISLVARQYVANGWALVPIPSGTKGPNTAGWNRPENCIRTAAECSRIKDNVGLAHKYSRTCVLDFDDLVKSAAWLKSQGLDFDELWNSPQAVRISSGRPNRGKLLFKLPEGVPALSTHPLHEFGLELRSASSNGMTVQDVLPPSIHPDTGLPYEWDYAEPALGDWRHPPVLPADVLAAWQKLSLASKAPLERKEGAGECNTEAAQEVIAEFDPHAPYHQWIQVGMALHHEFNGGDEGLDLWDEWSTPGAEYKGRDDLEYHWRTFGRGDGALSTLDSLRAIVRMRPVSLDEFEVLVSQEMAAAPATKTGGIMDDFDDMSGDEPPASRDLGPVPKRRPFEFMSAAQFMGRPPLQWIIKGILPKAAMGVLYGASASGKTFLALDMALSISRGLDWRGLRTTQGGVAYVVAEGATGFQSRMQAYCQANSIGAADLPIHLLDEAPNMMDAKALAPLGAELRKLGPLSVIFMDTYARVMGNGNENDAKDTNKVVANCYLLHKLTGAIIVLVHHTGKDETKGARGSGALRAAADVELEVIRTNKYRALRIGKMKDGRDDGEFKFTLNDVVIGWDEDGDDITSCVVEHLAAEAVVSVPTGPVMPDPAKAPMQALILDTLSEYIGGEVEKDNLIQHVRENTPRDGNGQEDRNWKSKITRAMNKLLKDGLIVEIAGNIKPGSPICD